DTVYTFANKKVYRSTDFGNNWNALTMTDFVNSGKVIRNLAGSRRSNAVALASSGGQFWVSTNNGTTWTTSGDVTAGSSYTSYVWFNTENDQILYGATVAPNANAHHLFRSSNGGTNWTPIDGSSAASNGLPFGIPIHVVQNLPGSLNTLFVGTDFGVYRSTDGGDTWTRFGEGLPLVGVRDLYLAPDGSFIRIATFGRGVWEAALTATGAPLDANGDGKVDPYDLLELLKRYGSTDAADLAKADFNGDSAINDADLTLLLAAL
ncbi:MAG: dockerin type I domain-containing protein, partial [Firmicutes bacterium]|nr:dockerin type I domain-containing protein [Bacillota bacterium]